MRKIEKGREPADSGLVDMRMTPGAIWGSVTAAAREALCREQLGLCAYCMARTRTEKVEHFLSRHANRSLQFDWSNLLAVCAGDKGEPTGADRFHCDTYRGNLTPVDQALPLDPKGWPDIASYFEYRSSGEIAASSGLDVGGREKAEEMIRKLNLQCGRYLKENRAAVYRAAQRAVMRLENRTGSVSRARVLKLLSDARRVDSDGFLNAFVGVAEYYFLKKLRQLR